MDTFHRDAIQRLIDYKDTRSIKVITGIRRCGKSMLMEAFYAYLLKQGIPSEQVVLINFESSQYDDIKDDRDLTRFVQTLHVEGRLYLLFDEIQRVTHWEKAINGFTVDLNCDLYLTGSNADLLSSELATYLSGRYVEIHLLPLSYADYHAALAGQRHDTWPSYFRYGGFPGFLEYPQSDRACRDYLSGIYHTVVLRDIQTRNNRLDMSLFELILKFLLDNIGSPISSNRIADALTASSRKTYVSTVSEYIDLMCRAFILYRAERFDLQGKRILQSGYKYYVADHGLRNLILGFRTFDQGHMLENIVFLEFIRRGYDVKIGQNKHSEVDFVVRHEQGIAYYQVCLSLADPQVLDREARALLALRDNYPKTILTLDPIGRQDHEGIVIQNIQDFLLQQPDQA